MASNFTVQDVLGILFVVPFFSLILVFPGYLVGFASNVLDFRRRGISERLLLALAISVAVSPYAINILCRFFSVGIVAALYLVLGVACIGRLLHEWRCSQYTFRIKCDRTTKIAIGLVSVWVVVCLISLPDMQLGQRIYSTAAVWDYSVRSPFIASALRTGAPPANPFFYPGHSVPARYYYYWNVVCALPAFLSKAGPRVTLYASCIWSGLLLAAMIPLYLKHFLEQASKLRVACVAGMALLAVTGLDLIPTLGIIGFGRVHPPADMEWWDTCQIASWLDASIWVPHHVAALTACLAAYLFLWKATCKGNLSTRIWLIALAALGFSSAAGLSVYVTFVFGEFILAWVAYLVVRGKFFAALLHGAVGALALLLSIGYIRDLLGPGSRDSGLNEGGNGAASHFFAFAPRQLPFQFHFHSSLANISLWALLAFFMLFLELGIFMLVGLIQANRDWRRWRTLSEAQKALWVMGGSSLAMIMFVRSTVIGANDLAWRGSMILQFVLLLWAAIYLTNRFTTHREAPARGFSDQQLLDAALCVLLAIGGASTLYQLGMLRVYALLRDEHHWTDFMQLADGHETYALRDAYAQLDRVMPANAVVQYNPDSSITTPMMVYSRYQQADGQGPGCITEFGGSAAECVPVHAGLQAIFDPDSGGISSKAELDRNCQALHIDALVVNALDPIWNRKDSWVWQEPPMIQNDFVRIFDCGSGR